MYIEKLKENDPEFAELFKNFACDEVVNEKGIGLDSKTRYMAVLATLIGCQGIDLYKEVLSEALDDDVTPVEAKEIVYQSAAYLGLGRVFPFFNASNEVMMQKAIKLPLEGQSTASVQDRLEKGNQAQVDIFGENMRGFQNAGPEETRHINKWLADNCFGDYYTRTGLNY